MPLAQRLWMALHRRFQHGQPEEPGKIGPSKRDGTAAVSTSGDTFEKFLREFREHSAEAEEQQERRKRAR
jgi:hypothetical protein